MAPRHTPRLGAEKALSLVGDQWFIAIVHALMSSPRRFSELSRIIAPVSKKVLTETLRKMERDGFVRRTIYTVAPPHTEYELTDLGRSIVPPLQALCRWATEHYDEVEANRVAFEKQSHADGGFGNDGESPILRPARPVPGR